MKKIRELISGMKKVRGVPKIDLSSTRLKYELRLNRSEGQVYLYVQAKQASMTQRGVYYTPQVRIPVTLDKSGVALRVSTKTGIKVKRVLPVSASTLVSVRCTCEDYRFTWFLYNKKAGSHLGKDFPPYTRKTTYMPERNPLHVAGICKHLYILFKLLSEKKLLKI